MRLVRAALGRSAVRPSDEGTRLISPRVDRLLEQRRLALRERDRGRQARAPDQLLLPQPRRGHLRGVPAADGRHRLEELPHDRPRGSRGRARSSTATGKERQEQARWRASSSASPAASPPTRRWSSRAWPCKAGHARARHPDRGVDALRRRRVVRRASPARRCSSTEWERDPLRGAFPGDPAARARRRSAHLESWPSAPTSSLIAPASANTIAKLAAGLADNLLTAAALACRAPAGRRAGDERRACTSTRPRRPTSRACASAA